MTDKRDTILEELTEVMDSMELAQPRSPPPLEKEQPSTTSCGIRVSWPNVSVGVQVSLPPEVEESCNIKAGPSNQRTVGIMGPKVYIEVRPDTCWRCGQAGHSRANCVGVPILFCSRCGLMSMEGLLSFPP